MDLNGEDVLKKVVAKIAAQVYEIVERRDSGPIVLEFHEGEFKRAKATKTL